MAPSRRHRHALPNTAPILALRGRMSGPRHADSGLARRSPPGVGQSSKWRRMRPSPRPLASSFSPPAWGIVGGFQRAQVMNTQAFSPSSEHCAPGRELHHPWMNTAMNVQPLSYLPNLTAETQTKSYFEQMRRPFDPTVVMPAHPGRSDCHLVGRTAG